MLLPPGKLVQHVYFPGGGFCSVLSVLDDGGMVEVATVGREGMLGVFEALHGASAASSATMVQGETDICYRMQAEPFRMEMDRRGAFYTVVTRYAQALVGFIMQATACSAVHRVEQRLARWLLMAHDRMESDAFPLTQEFAAMMLGATRPTVTLAAGASQHAGLITYHPGHVATLDREKLEAATCECYRLTADRLTAATDGSPTPLALIRPTALAVEKRCRKPDSARPCRRPSACRRRRCRARADRLAPTPRRGERA